MCLPELVGHFVRAHYHGRTGTTAGQSERQSEGSRTQAGCRLRWLSA